VRVIVAGQLPRSTHNAPLHLFSASPELVGVGQGAYKRRSERTSRLLGPLFEKLREEGFTMTYTMKDFERDYIKDHFSKLTPEEQRDVLRSLPPEQRLAGLSEEQIQEYLQDLRAGHAPTPPKPRRRKSRVRK
jgi:hypothetical protein